MIATLSSECLKPLYHFIGTMIHQALSPGGVDWLPPLILLRV